MRRSHAVLVALGLALLPEATEAFCASPDAPILRGQVSVRDLTAYTECVAKEQRKEAEQSFRLELQTLESRLRLLEQRQERLLDELRERRGR